MDKFDVIIASLPDREQLVGEVYYDAVQWAEISEEKEKQYLIQFYSHPREKYWEFTLDDAISAIQDAKQRLVEVGPQVTFD